MYLVLPTLAYVLRYSHQLRYSDDPLRPIDKPEISRVEKADCAYQSGECFVATRH
jgi:hypothetical protein